MDRILIVCMGNICRSPMAESVARRLVQDAGLSGQFEFDSAGTHAHPNRPRPDPRVKSVLTRKGYELIDRRARPVRPADFERFDLILAMDRENLAGLERNCAAELAHKLHLFLDFTPGLEGTDVPDPFFGDVRGFERVLDLCEAGVRGLLDSACAKK